MLNDPSETWMQDKYVIRYKVTPSYLKHIDSAIMVVTSGRGHQLVYTRSAFKLPVNRTLAMFHQYSE